MMEEEEEDTLFDQEGLLGRRDEALSEKKEFKRKLLKTAALSMSFFCLGLCIAIPGPTLLELGKRVNRRIEHMTFIFTARSVGYLIGSLTGGVLFDFFDQQILLFYTLSAVAVATASIPWCTTLIYLSAFVCVQGVALGVLDTGGNIFCIKIWTQKSAPFMQALHFAFGIGAFIAPLMARPFLVDPVVLSDNITKVDYYPVNFELPSLESVSGQSRSVRGFHHYAFWDLDYTLDHEPKHSPLTFQHSHSDSDELLNGHNFTNPEGSDIISKQFRKLHRNIVNDIGQKLESANNTQAFGNTGDMNSTVTLTSTTTTVRPKKPVFNDGGDLSRSLADSEILTGNIVNDIGQKLEYAIHQNKKHLDEFKNYSSVSKHFGINQSSRDDVTGRRNMEAMFFRFKREESGPPEAVNSSDSGNNTQAFSNTGDMNSTVTLSSTTTTVRPKKPVVNDGGDLSGSFADSEKINLKLKDIINKAPTENLKNEKDSVPVGDDMKDVDSNNTSSLVNATATSLDTDRNDTLLIGNDTLLTEDTTTAPTTISVTSSSSTVSSTASSSSTVTTTTTTTTVSTTTPTTTTVSTTAPTTTVTPTSTLTSTTSATTTTLLSTSTADLTEATTNPLEFATKPIEAVDDLSTVNTSIGKNISSRSEDDLLSNVFAAVIGMSKIQIAYSLIGMLLAVNASLFLFLYCKDRAQSSPAITRSHEDLTRPPDTKCFVSLLIILLFLFFFTYVGMEVTFGGLLTTFAVYYPLDRWTSSSAAVLTALFWGCLALGRCFAIFIARCFKPPCMMVSNLCLTVLGAVILSVFVKLNSAMLWIGTVTLGLGMSSLFPTAISWANSYYPLTGRATAIFLAGSGVGEMVVPVMSGFLFKVNPMSLMYVTLTLSILMSLVYLCLQLVVYQRGKTSTRRSRSGFMRLNNFEDMNDAVDMDTIEFSEGGVTDIAEITLDRSHRKEEEESKENGDTYNTTEFTKLVELSD